MTRCTHDQTVCENRWRTDGRPCCGVCSHTPAGGEGRSSGKHCRTEGGVRLLRTHVRGCDTAGCEGCEPCKKDHCTMPRCFRHLRPAEDRVCTPCVGGVRDDLKRIADLCLVVHIVANEGGVNSGAAVLTGPVPEHTTYTARRSWALGGGLCRCEPDSCPDTQPTPSGPLCTEWRDCDHDVCRRRTGRPTCPDLLAWLEDAGGDQRHPLWVLGSWDWLAALALDHHRRLKTTVASAVSYLDGNLTELARREVFGFDDFAREVRECREHVEQVLLVSPHIERGAPCPECDRAGRKAKPLECHFDSGDTTGDGDLWVCPTCEASWTQGQYDKFVQRELLDRAPHLTATDLAKRLGVPPSTVRSWTQPTRHVTRGEGIFTTAPKLKPVGKFRGRKTYSVEQAEQLLRGRDEMPAV